MLGTILEVHPTMFIGLVQQVMVTITIVPQTTMPPPTPTTFNYNQLPRLRSKQKKNELMWRHKNECKSLETPGS
jgi:hypothetical protein